MKLTDANLLTLHSKHVTNAFGSDDAYKVVNGEHATKESNIASGRWMLKCKEAEGLVARCGRMHYRLTDRARQLLGVDHDRVANKP